MMQLQDAISVHVGETNSEVTNFPGVVPLANLAADLVPLRDLDRLLPASYQCIRLKTLRFRLLALPALITRHARRLYLRLPRGHPHGRRFAAIAN